MIQFNLMLNERKPTVKISKILNSDFKKFLLQDIHKPLS